MSVETDAANGSERDAKSEDDAKGVGEKAGTDSRSSSEGGEMPISVYSQSI